MNLCKLYFGNRMMKLSSREVLKRAREFRYQNKMIILLYWNIMFFFMFWRFWVYGFGESDGRCCVVWECSKGSWVSSLWQRKICSCGESNAPFPLSATSESQTLKLLYIYMFFMYIYDTNACKSTLVPYMFICMWIFYMYTPFALRAYSEASFQCRLRNYFMPCTENIIKFSNFHTLIYIYSKFFIVPTLCSS